MQIPILIDHLGIVPGHPLQGCKHHFFDLGSIVALLQGILDLATPISIGNGIFFSGFPKQWKTKVPILGPSKFSMRPGTLPLHGMIPLAVPLSRGCPGRALRGFRLLARASIDLSVQCTCCTTLFFFNILLSGVKLFMFWTLRLGAQQSGALCKGGFIKVHFLKLLLHEELIGPSGHASPLGRFLGHGRLGLCNWRHSQGIQMSNSLLGPLVNELSRHLHLMSGFLESSLVGCDIYHVASPVVYTRQLVGIVK